MPDHLRPSNASDPRRIVSPSSVTLGVTRDRRRGGASRSTPFGTQPRAARWIAYVSPLIGLLGTVTGLIQAFVQLSASNGYATLADVSSGVYQSLLTTAASLAVAIPTILAYCFLSARLNALMHEMERAGIEIVNILTDTETPASIIEFDPSSQAASEKR